MQMNRTVRIKIEKWAIWIALISTLLLLHRLLPVIFLTFVLTYIGSSLVAVLGRVIPWRRLNVALVFILFLNILAGVGLLVVPRLFAEAKGLAVDYIARDAGQPQPGPPPADRGAAAGPEQTLLDRQTKKYVDSILIQLVGRQSFDAYSHSEEYQALLSNAETSLRSFIPRVVTAVRGFANASLAVVLQFFLSLILSFVILFDLPELRRGARSFATGRTAEIYTEVAPGITAFSVILGRAFQAQTVVALVNALLTSIGFLLLGIPSIALLATIVFVCSYIPVAGVFLSTIPAALLAFKAGGPALVLWLVMMILVVHAVEAYGVNPLIYGRRLRMHPVVILAILLVAEHLFGIWGLLLGVPIAAFIRDYVLGVAPLETTTTSNDGLAQAAE